MAVLKESCPDQVESLFASVYKREELDCVFQLCGLQKIQVGSCQVQISAVLLLLPIPAGSGWLCPSVRLVSPCRQCLALLCQVAVRGTC